MSLRDNDMNGFCRKFSLIEQELINEIEREKTKNKTKDKFIFPTATFDDCKYSKKQTFDNEHLETNSNTNTFASPTKSLNEITDCPELKLTHKPHTHLEICLEDENENFTPQKEKEIIHLIHCDSKTNSFKTESNGKSSFICSFSQSIISEYSNE